VSGGRSCARVAVSSAIWTPGVDDAITPGQVPITGYAWSGLDAIAKVEVSTDNGNSWNEATITGDGEHSWARFEYMWEAKPGPTGLFTRATDVRGASQPGQCGGINWGISTMPFSACW
jgi:sulfane dehydrogenase subunit SoxC